MERFDQKKIFELPAMQKKVGFGVQLGTGYARTKTRMRQMSNQWLGFAQSVWKESEKHLPNHLQQIQDGEISTSINLGSLVISSMGRLFCESAQFCEMNTRLDLNITTKG